MHEYDVDRQGIQVSFDLIAQSLCTIETGRILFRRNDQPGRRYVVESLVDAFNVFLLELVMVTEGHHGKMGCQRRYVVLHLFG